MEKPELTAERLRSILQYNPLYGFFTWLVSRGTVKAGSAAGFVGAQGYHLIKIDSAHHGAHRLAWLHYHGKWPVGEIDHINGCRDDNRIENLRDVDKAANQQNRNAPRRDNKTGLQGVFKHKDCERWVAQIQAGKRQRYLGLFRTPNEAHSAYLAAKAELHDAPRTKALLGHATERMSEMYADPRGSDVIRVKVTAK